MAASLAGKCKLKVLLIEDSPDDALLISHELRKGGYDIDLTRIDSETGVREALERFTWDLVITDHNLPGFDSKVAPSLIRELDLDLPVIIVSGSIGEEIAVEAMRSGAHDYIMKDNLRRLVPAVDRELKEAENRRSHRQAEALIHHMAYHDSLTNLVNRAEFERRLGNAINANQQRKLQAAMIYLDLDQFKVINDTCGHLAGDELLRQLSALLKSRMRDRDTLARLGGDEFGVLLESCPQECAKRIADEILQVIQTFRFSWKEKSFTLGASIGVVMINEDMNKLEDALSSADIACYTAKDMGRNRVHFFHPGDRELARRRGEMQWVSRLNQALENNCFRLYRQPIQSLNSDPNKRFEVLLRLQGDESAIIPPGAFIPAAERYNLMPTLDRWVISEVFSRFRGNGKHNGPTTMTFINLSGASLNNSDTFSFIREQLQEFNVRPDSICFEITETVAISNLSYTLEFINDIKKIGCKFALDDFGTGFSSFSYLKSLPVDYVKIDGSFVRTMLRDAMNMRIVEAINNIGHVAGAETIAEYVEDPALLDELRLFKVDYGQGFALGRPNNWQRSETGAGRLITH